MDDEQIELSADRAWQDQANCLGVDPDLFFPERGASTREAKEVCKGCVVRDECLEYALANGEKFGIWGGLSERERRKLRRQRAQTSRNIAVSTVWSFSHTLYAMRIGRAPTQIAPDFG
ncbi:MAG: WhiB family transcriptional regulator [Actinobacteria bacterium]|nr:WhiB family transcriptional regulator [Actinomycetota bacterium]